MNTSYSIMKMVIKMKLGLSDECYIQKKKTYIMVLNKLKDAINYGNSEVIKDAVIRRFEYTFEIACKTVKSYLELIGVYDKVGSPREIIQTGYKQGIIEDGESWIKMMLSRNSLSHIYDEKTSREIYEYIVSEYIDLFENLKKKLNEEIL